MTCAEFLKQSRVPQSITLQVKGHTMGSIGRGRDFCLGCCQEAGAEAQLVSFCLPIKQPQDEAD